MSRTRESIQAQLLEYLYGELSPDERAEFEEGLLQYPDLQAELQEMTKTREAWGDVPEALPVSSAVRETVLAEARRVSEERRESTPTGWERFLAGWNQPAFASALALVLVGGVGLYVADFMPLDQDGPERVLEPASPVAVVPEVPAAASSPTPSSLEVMMAAEEELGELEEAWEDSPVESALKGIGSGASEPSPQLGAAPRVLEKQKSSRALRQRKEASAKSMKSARSGKSAPSSKGTKSRKGRKNARSLKSGGTSFGVGDKSRGGVSSFKGQEQVIAPVPMNADVPRAEKRAERAPQEPLRNAAEKPRVGVLGSSASGEFHGGGKGSFGAAEGLSPVLPPAAGTADSSASGMNVNSRAASEAVPSESDEDAHDVDPRQESLAKQMDTLANQSSEERSESALVSALELARKLRDWKQMKRLVGWLAEAHGEEAARPWRQILRRR